MKDNNGLVGCGAIRVVRTRRLDKAFEPHLSGGVRVALRGFARN